jgi:hypothetical protein
MTPGLNHSTFEHEIVSNFSPNHHEIVSTFVSSLCSPGLIIFKRIHTFSCILVMTAQARCPVVGCYCNAHKYAKTGAIKLELCEFERLGEKVLSSASRRWLER